MKDTSKSFRVFIVVLLVIILWGFYNWGLALSGGHGITGGSDFVPWGLDIVGFVFFVGASAGATIIGLMIHGFEHEHYKPLGVRAIVFSGSLARTYWSRAAVASRLLKKVKKDGLFQQIQSKLSLIMNSITEEDLKNAKLREKVQSARVIGEIANKLLK